MSDTNDIPTLTDTVTSLAHVTLSAPEVVPLLVYGDQGQELVKLAADGAVFWKGREIQSDEDFKRAMIATGEVLAGKRARTSFTHDIERFNSMYKLPMPAAPTTEGLKERLVAFLDIVREEINEGDELLAKLDTQPEIDTLAELADWLGDVQVFFASEMRRFGLSNDAVLSIIMQSNFSKLGADGQPIYDERGKVAKGPGYWKPEAKLAAMIQQRKDEHDAS